MQQFLADYAAVHGLAAVNNVVECCISCWSQAGVNTMVDRYTSCWSLASSGKQHGGLLHVLAAGHDRTGSDKQHGVVLH